MHRKVCSQSSPLLRALKHLRRHPSAGTSAAQHRGDEHMDVNARQRRTRPQSATSLPYGATQPPRAVPGVPLNAVGAGQGGGGWSGFSRMCVLLMLAVIYTISPIDIIPDIIPVLGLVDDLGMWGWVIYTCLSHVFANKQPMR